MIRSQYRYDLDEIHVLRQRLASRGDPRLEHVCKLLGQVSEELHALAKEEERRVRAMARAA